jgi:uncharacterized protein with GYD domain
MSKGRHSGFGEIIRRSEGLMKGAGEEDVIHWWNEDRDRFLIGMIVMITAEDEVRFVELPAAPVSWRFTEEGEFGGAWGLKG